MKKYLVITLLFLLALSVAQANAATVQWLIHGTTTNLLTPNSVASNGYTAASATYNNTIGQTGNGYLYCRFEAILTFAAAPTANSAVYIWILESLDGTTFADTPTASIITSSPSLTIPVTSGQVGTRQAVSVRCPNGQFKIAAQLNNTGQTTTASGNIIRLVQYTIQVQ